MEFWPKGVGFRTVPRGSYFTLNEYELPPEYFVGWFVEAMFMYLMKECSPSTFTPIDLDNGTIRIHEYHDGTGYEISRNFDAPTLIEALSLACEKNGMEQIVEQIISNAEKDVEKMKAEGWTQQDFANGLKDMFGLGNLEINR